jgi:hypothetical protein
MSSPEPATIITVLKCVSLVFGLLAVISGCRVARQLARSVRCNGRVTKLVKIPDGINSLFRPIFTFTDESGKKHTVASSIAGYPAPYAVGETVEILYPRGQPSLAECRSFFAQWGLTSFLVGFATITYLLASVFSKQV